MMLEPAGFFRSPTSNQTSAISYNTPAGKKPEGGSVNVFGDYKPIRNKIKLLAIEEALAVVWAYCQYLQIDNFRFPNEIEVSKQFLHQEIPQKWISEWELELLAKEIILNGSAVSSKARSLRSWKTISELVNSIKDLENRIYGRFGSTESVLVEMIRIAHRQFIWQGNPPNAASIIRYFKIFNRPLIDQICLERIGLNVWQIYMCGVAWMGFYLERPAITLPLRSDIKGLPVESFEKFLTFTSRPLADLRSLLKVEQQYNENFAYAYSSLRAFPLVRMTYQGSEAVVCPLMTLLYWRFTGGLYYELIEDARFGNEFGEGFQDYVGEVIERAISGTSSQRIGEKEYSLGRLKKRTVDWIIDDGKSAIFLECKSKRLSWSAKSSLTDLAALEADIESMSSAVVQTYKTIADYNTGAYPHYLQKADRKIFPAVVTLENWRMFGPVMLKKLAESIATKFDVEGLASTLIDEMPYSIWAIEELEVGLQILNGVGIAEFMEGKLKDKEMRSWDWHAYMTNKYQSFRAKRLFDKEYDEMFVNLFSAQSARS